MSSSEIMRFACLTFAVLGVVAALSGAEPIRVAFSPEGAEHFEQNSRVLLGAEAQGDDFRMVVKGDRHVDTAWRMMSDRTAVPSGTAAVAFDFEIHADAEWNGFKLISNDKWGSRLTWYDAGGTELKVDSWVDALGQRHDSEVFRIEFQKGGYRRFRLVFDVPDRAAFVTITFGTDAPDILPGEYVGVRGLTATVVPKGASRPAEIKPDLKGPRVRSLVTAPLPDPSRTVRYALEDDSGIDWGSVRVTLSDCRTAVPFARVGDGIELRPEDGRWQEGDHHVVITVKDAAGNERVSRKGFHVGMPPNVPKVTLREDGVTLVDGEPFFPIGLYDIRPREANLYSLDRAFQDLKAAGVNFVHSYTHARKSEFLPLCRKYGMRAWVSEWSAGIGSEWFERTGRNDSSVLAWYVGDDTSMNVSPEAFADRVEGISAMEGRRLTCQADAYTGNFREYAALTDVFMPEIYPILDDGGFDGKCVAKTIDVMEGARRDQKAYGGDRPRAVWPIIQYFKGWKYWKRMPRPDEVYAMSFAALIHGGKGITWYTYGGFVEPEKKAFNYGVTSSAETWSTMTNITSRIAALSPVLLSPDVPQPPAPTVTNGPKTDACGRPAVTMLLKRHKGDVWMLAVNATDKRVMARLPVPDVSRGDAAVAWEKRKVAVRDGCMADEFGPFAVHVYRWVGR